MDKQQESRIRKVEEAVDQIGDQVSQIYIKLTDVEEKVERALTRLDEHHGLLYGTGEKSGLLAWKERATETLDELKVALKGYGKEPGLIAVIQNLTDKIEEYDDTKKWIIRLIIGYIITVILGLFIIGMK